MGDAAAFAFYPNKQMTTGEGGMILTNHDEIARLCRSMRNHGRPEMGEWLEHERLGFNYRMDEMSAALGLSQFRRLETFLAKRERVAAVYTDRLSAFDWVSSPVVRPYVRMSWFVYVVTLAEEINRDAVMTGLAERGIPRVPTSRRFTCSRTSASGSATWVGSCKSRSRSPRGRWLCPSTTTSRRSRWTGS